ncbi:glutathione S-transferase [Bordetella genomosp. 1]|uniref:Glutathione S-transferase n=1 Tax=Bordetella genomosp. 1 TaxID=1395607 RepID=A0A261RWA4_9BORD|nr:glutathione S-transferase [Bordetella genomosp. 1]MDQ8032238.1 glutathione S-transferase [Bordetella sp.]OZI29181.1 glutathione S-transferase [Bordetella genomosp. 1]OZI65086.1 glutathione S-transferase [Bordetella genomosp. 1]
MKIFYSPASPYVRKCMVVALELGVAGRIEKLAAAANPVNRDQTVVASNPLGKVPTFLTEGGEALYDSRVICEYLDSEADGRMFPREGRARWHALTQQALGDGLLDAALLARYETAMRPAELRWDAWMKGQMDKIASSLARIEQLAGGLGERVDIGTITFGCALGYLDFRFPDLDWRAGHPQTAKWFEAFNQRASMQATLPHA